MENFSNSSAEKRSRFEFKFGSNSGLGNVSYSMLLEDLMQLDLLHVPRSCSKSFTWYVTVSGNQSGLDEVYRRGTLFLCHSDIAKHLLDAFPDSFCVVVVEEGEDYAWVNEKNRCNRLIAIRQSERFYYYDALLQKLFIANLVWENEMARIVYSRGQLDKLIEVSESMLGNFVCITDTGYNLIAYSHGIEPPDDEYRYLVENYCYSSEDIAEIETRVLSSVTKTQIVFCEPNKNCCYPTLHCPVLVNSEYVFHITMVCAQDSLDCLKDLFSKFTRHAVELCNEFWKTTVNLESSWHRVLIGLLDHAVMTDEYLKTQLAQTAISASHQFRLLRFQFDSSMPYQERLCVVEATKELNEGLCYPFMYKENLLVLLYTTSAHDSALSGEGVFNDTANIMYQRFGIAAGASQVFYNIEDIEIAYRQALVAFALRTPLRNEYESLNGISDIPCYAFEHALKFYMLTEGCDTDLINYSFEHNILQKLAEEDQAAGTNIVQMVWVYLNNDRNATETAKLIHVHRNTVLYHISRLEKRFEVSFESPLLRSRMMLDFHRLLLENKL